MTNSSLSSALKGAFVPVLALALAGGCGPDDGSAEYADGEAAYGARNLERAARCFAQCVERAPGNVNALVMLARVRCDLGEIAAAKEAIAKAVALEPDAPDVALLDAEVAFYANEYEHAARRFSGVAGDEKLTPEQRSLGWTGLGIVEMASNDRRDYARIAFLRAIRLDRRNASARYHLGLLYRGDDYGYLPAALEQFEAFVHLEDASSPRAQHVQRVMIPAINADIQRRAAEKSGAARRDAAASTAALQRAEAEWKRGQFKAARAEYEKAVSADVLSYEAALGLAKAWEKTDATDAGRRRTLECYRAACMLRASAVSTFLTAGDLATKLGQHATAAELYSRAIAANPADISAIDGLIRALRKVGGKAKIADAYQSYRESIPVRKRK